MTTVVVPNLVDDMINRALDIEYEKLSPIERAKAELDKELHYNTLLAYYNEFGILPGFSLLKKEDNEAG